MCGIWICICRSTDTDDTCYGTDLNFNNALSRRGPDVKGELKIEFNGWKLHFIGHVLWTQGSSPTKQPLIDCKSNVLLWNGDVFDGPLGHDNDCDSLNVLDRLSNEKGDVLSCFEQIIGPYAFIYWNNVTKCLWFGRDVIGRHSLLSRKSFNSIIICSTGNKNATDLIEVPAQGLFMINLGKSVDNLELSFYPWKHCLSELNYYWDIPVNVCESVCHAVIKYGETKAEWLKNEPDSSDIEILTKIINESKHSCDVFSRCLEEIDILSRVDNFLTVLSKSVEIRIRKQPAVCKKCMNLKETTCSHAKVGVLFSGGLDSTVLACIANKYVPVGEPIDLYNVAFQNPTKKNMNYNVPDRKTGELSLEELKRLSPEREWNFIKVDVTHDELQQWRQEHVSHLIHPLNTILDDSLGCALWFAARGQGTINNGEKYTSSARIVLLGMGADEMLGGYMRHRTQWRHEHSWQSLAKSLANDLAIIGQRNLGRDNRIVSDHGCQPRLPYLDEHVISFIQSLPPWQRCYLTDEMPVGIGDKLLLRLVAWKLGLHNVATYPKRAMQFGSRIANSREKGNNISERL